jgi:hypothetical protein
MIRRRWQADRSLSLSLSLILPLSRYGEIIESSP